MAFSFYLWPYGQKVDIYRSGWDERFSLMDSMQPLIKTALLGTNTGKLRLPPAPAGLGPVLIQLEPGDPEASLLTASALVGLASLAGYQPSSVEGPSATPCSPAELLPLLPERAAQCFERMLAGEFEAVLPEFLQLAAQYQLRLPPETLPAILELGQTGEYPGIPEVIGERGRWLARQNPAWGYVLPQQPDQAWETGARHERFSALKSLRAASPQRARALVQSTWEQDSPEDRALFLAAFDTGLSMEDEPLLEACLNDKRKEVRAAALDLLVRLPESRLVKRAVERVEPLLKFRSKFLGGEFLDVRLPESLDPAAKRDGAGGAVLRKKMGEKSNWLAQLLSAVPPSLWCRKWGRSPEKILGAALGSEWKEPVILGWWLATHRAQDSIWAEAFSQFVLKRAEGQAILAGENWRGISMLLEPITLEALALSTIQEAASEPAGSHPLWLMLEACERPWSAGMGRAVVGSAQRASSTFHYRFSQLLPKFALWIPPELADEFSAGWVEEPNGIWKARIDEFIAVLNFRQQFHGALKR
jgi:hypothetical protein